MAPMTVAFVRSENMAIVSIVIERQPQRGADIGVFMRLRLGLEDFKIPRNDSEVLEVAKDRTCEVADFRTSFCRTSSSF